MLKQFETKLYKTLIYSDFFLQDSSQESIFSFHYLDGYRLTKNIKQFTRLILFIKKCNNGRITIQTSNEDFHDIISIFLQKYPISIPIDLDLKPFYPKEVRMILLLETENNAESLKKCFVDKTFLIQNVSSHSAANNVYQIYNSISSIKKMVFILTLIHKTLG